MAKLDKMKAAVLSFLMISAVAMGALGIAAGASDRAPNDGYGITASIR